MAMSLEQAKAEHGKAVRANRAGDVIEYTSKEKQSEKVFEVTEGYKYLPGGKVLGPGQRFHPTERQVLNGSLRGKAEEIGEESYRSVRRSGGTKYFGGVDFPKEEEQAPEAAEDSPELVELRKLPMAPTTADYAVSQGMTSADFEGVEPEGTGGRFTRDQVERMAAEKVEG